MVLVRPQVALFAIAVFASAFLIFIVQPMVGKHILPWFGGVPAVWLLCLCFYQFALFAGYGYAHLLVSRVSSSRHLLIHALLFAAALAVLPVLPDASWKPGGATPPSAHILAMLTANVALPFVLLAATGPLLQAWYAGSFPGRSPYILYAVSNAGSLLALLAYPFVVEPNMTLHQTSRSWSWAFVACGLAVLGCAWLASRNQRQGSAATREGSAAAREGQAAESDVRTSPADVSLWILLPACAVVLFMAVTNELCLDMASFPFLWIVPLAIYLLTFILSFGSGRFYRRGLFAIPAAAAMGVLIWFRLAIGGSFSVSTEVVPIAAASASYSITLFLACMLLHGELYRLRPPAERLTLYYLCISGGGSLAGIFVGIVAPRIFSEYYELSLGLGACWLLFALACMRQPGSLLRQRGPRRAFAGIVAASVCALGVMAIHSGGVGKAELIYQKRNFFNILRVIEKRPENPKRHNIRLKSGSTVHGAQSLLPDLKRLPIMYFGAASGIGLVMERRTDEPMKVGITGLGVGSLAAYGRRGDHYRYYEIDPDVVEIARDKGYFSYLADSSAELDFVLGDARLSLETELQQAGPQNFDLLILDAFRSDAIPVHLITTEAFALYIRHLKPAGVIAVHGSSVNFDLTPLLFRLADAHGMHAVAVSNLDLPELFQFDTEWVILSADSTYLDAFPALVAQQRKAMRIPPGGLYLTYPKEDVVRAAPLWTDDYSDLFSALRPVSWKDFF